MTCDLWPVTCVLYLPHSPGGKRGRLWSNWAELIGMFWNYHSHKDTFFCFLFRCFPRATLIVELTHASNMRFMKFNADISLPPDLRSESMSSFKSRSLRESVKVKIENALKTKLSFLIFWTESKIHTSFCRLCLFVKPEATFMILDTKTKRVICSVLHKF